MAEKSSCNSTQEACEPVTAHFHRHPYMDRLDRITSIFLDTAGHVTISTLTLGSRIGMVEVIVPTWTGVRISSTEVETTVTADGGAMSYGQTTTTEVRVMRPTATMETTLGTGVHVGSKGTHPTPPNPRIDIDSSTFSRPTKTKVGQDI